MNAVVQRQDEGALATVQDMSGGLLDVIARAARDPNVDITKMERLFELQERVQDRNAKVSYQTALAEMQPRLPVISERGKILDRNKQTQSTYAFWEDVNEHIKPLLAEFGFSLSFRTGKAGSDVTVTGILAHRDGHSEETTMSLPADGSGSKNAVQAVASSTSYGKRYTAFALLNITTRGEDDDGVRAGAPAAISEEQEATIEALIQDVGADRTRFLRYIKVSAVSDILARDYQRVVNALEAKRSK